MGNVLSGTFTAALTPHSCTALGPCSALVSLSCLRDIAGSAGPAAFGVGHEGHRLLRDIGGPISSLFTPSLPCWGNTFCFSLPVWCFPCPTGSDTGKTRRKHRATNEAAPDELLAAQSEFFTPFSATCLFPQPFLQEIGKPQTLKLFCPLKSFFWEQIGASFLWHFVPTCAALGFQGFAKEIQAPRCFRGSSSLNVFAGGVCAVLSRSWGFPCCRGAAQTPFLKQSLYGWERGLETSLSPWFVISQLQSRDQSQMSILSSDFSGFLCSSSWRESSHCSSMPGTVFLLRNPGYF